jgi:signal transduction histidine kinase
MSTTLFCALAGLVLAVATTATAQHALTSIAAVRVLPAARAAEQLPVQLEATATYPELSNGGIFIHDQTEGVYLLIPPALQSNLVVHPGDRLKIKAVTDPGNYIPALVCQALTNEGSAALPTVVPVTAENIFSPALDCQWVQVSGVIVSAGRADAGQFVFTLELYGWNFKLLMRLNEEEIHEASTFMQRRVTFEGVAATVFNTQRQMTGRYFLVPALKFIHSGGDQNLVNIPVNRSVVGLLSSETTSENAVRVRGIVTAAAKSELYLRDEGGSLQVLVSDNKTYRPGDHIEVLGFAKIAPFRPVLRASEVIKLNSGEPLEPVLLNPSIDNMSSLQAELIKVNQAVFLGAQEGPDGIIAHCRMQDRFFEAVLPKPLLLAADLVPGSLMDIVGICELTTTHPLPRSEYVDGFRIHLANPFGLVVVSRPSWWTTKRSLSALAVVAGLGVLAIGWIWILRRQVMAQTKKVMAQTKIIGTQIDREARLHERQRIARELHDSIEQEMTGVAIQLSNVRRRLPSNPSQAEAELTLAQEMIRHCRAEARTSIRDLRNVALEQGGLVRAIEGLLAPLAEGSQVKFSMAVHGTYVRLAGRLESDLLRVSQEAVTNAVHHAAPAVVKVTLDYGEETVTLTVADDGCGFDLSAPPRHGHFGILGMKERANQQHGSLTIESRPGAGTQVTFCVPLSPANGSVSVPQKS